MKNQYTTQLTKMKAYLNKLSNKTQIKENLLVVTSNVVKVNLVKYSEIFIDMILY